MNGTKDLHTTKEDALTLFENAPDPKMLVWFEDAGHINLYDYDRSVYTQAVLKFLAVVHSSASLSQSSDKLMPALF